MKLDMQKLRKAMKETEEKIRAMKALKRESHQPRWGRAGNDDYQIGKLKVLATVLYSMRAAHRNRVHMQKCLAQDDGGWKVRAWTAEDQAALIADRLPEFQFAEPVTVAA